MHNNEYLNTEQVREWTKCALDFPYWCAQYVKINNPKKGIVPFELYDYQKRYYEALCNQKLLIVPKFRQGGFTTETLAYCLWLVIFQPQDALPPAILWVTEQDRAAVYTSQLAKQIFTCLPDWMKPHLSRFNDHEIVLENGRSICFTGCHSCKGRQVTMLVIDEAAFIADCHKVWQAFLPTLIEGGKAVVLSSAKVLKEKESNWFAETFAAAMEGDNHFHVFKARWSEHPSYDNEEWTDRMRATLGEVGWRTEVECEFVIRTEEEIKASRSPGAYQHGWKILDRDIREPVLVESPRAVQPPPPAPEAPWVIPDLEAVQETLDLNQTPCPKPGEIHITGVPPVADTHPEFPEELEMNVEEVWKNIEKVMPHTTKPISEKVEPFDYNSVNVDMLRIAGVYNDKGAIPLDKDYHEMLLSQIKRGLPPQLSIDLGGDALKVNSVPTKINAKAVDMAVVGLAELVGQNRAVDLIGRIVRRKLQRLF